MTTFFAVFFALFVFVMATAGVITAVGAADAAQYDIEIAAHLLKTIYLKAFGVPEIAAGPLSYILLAIPGVLAFYTVQAIFGRKRKSS